MNSIDPNGLNHSNHPVDAHITIHCQDWAIAQDSNTHLQNTSTDCNTNLQDNYTYNTPLRIVQTVLNISNQCNNNNQTDIEQCNNNSSTSSCNHLQRRFSEPIYIDNSNIQNSDNPDNSDNTNNNIQNNICTRHHHRRNSIAIKFNKPLYKKFI
ncbi:hypothetical protein MOSE0_A03444 [Monosporozyma servazzii]